MYCVCRSYNEVSFEGLRKFLLIWINSLQQLCKICYSFYDFLLFCQQNSLINCICFRNSGQIKPKDIVYDDQFNGSFVCEANPKLLGNIMAASPQQYMPLYENQSAVQQYLHLHNNLLDGTDMSRNVEIPGETSKAFDKRTC